MSIIPWGDVVPLLFDSQEPKSVSLKLIVSAVLAAVFVGDDDDDYDFPEGVMARVGCTFTWRVDLYIILNSPLADSCYQFQDMKMPIPHPKP